MKIAFPTNNQKTINEKIGLSKGFLIIDTNTNEKKYIPNPVMQEVLQKHIKLSGDCGEHGLGTGKVVPKMLKDEGVEMFVGREFGEGMLGNLELFGIKTFATDIRDIDEFISNAGFLNKQK